MPKNLEKICSPIPTTEKRFQYCSTPHKTYNCEEKPPFLCTFTKPFTYLNSIDLG